MLRIGAAALGSVMLLAACSPGSPAAAGGGSSTGTGTGTVSGWFEVGFGETAFEPLVDQLHIVWGSQGSAMFPMPIRGGGFELPPDPSDYTDERIPMLDLELDIDGHDDPVDGHFKRIANYPVTFTVQPDGSYEYLYVRVIVPDDQDAAALDGLPAHLTVHLRPYDSGPLEQTHDLTVLVDPAPG